MKIIAHSQDSMDFHGVNGFPWSPWIFVKSMFLRQNVNGRSKWLKIAKNCVLRFLHFYPLYRRFRLSRVFQTIDLEEIYRLNPK